MAKEKRDKLHAEWFWVDRWTASSAFHLDIESRGLYREMLSQAWLRGAKLPHDYEAIRRICGVTEKEWKRCWPKIESFWTVDGTFLINITQVVVYLDAKAAQDRAQARAQAGAQAKHQGRRQEDREGAA